MQQSILENLFVLELANNHWGRLERGLKIISDHARVVKDNNIHAAIKLQFRDTDSFIHKDFRQRSDIRYVKKTLDTKMPWGHYMMMVEATKQAGLVTMATPFDEFSVDKCLEFDLDVIKIASSSIDDKSLIEKIAATRKPTIVSTGGALLKNIDGIAGYFNDLGIPLAINHCVSLYPSEDEDLELNQIDFLKQRYPRNVIGLSTHEYKNWQYSLMIAYAKGARTFERHIDIDHDGVPVSAYCSLPAQVDEWFKAFNKAQEMCGSSASQKRPVPRREIEYLDALTRGVFLKRDLPAGHVLAAGDVYFSVPLLKGQVSCREFSGGEVLRHAIKADGALALSQIDSTYAKDPALQALVRERGLDATLPAPAAARKLVS